MAIGCYLEPYLPASFKGVSFKATDADSEHGRRGAEGEFPFGESTGYADLGRKIRTYRLSGRFDENSHVAQAAALISVCEAPGPGILVHPTRGIILSAACRSLKIIDKVENEQGVTYVEAEFVEANQWTNGVSLLGEIFGLGVAALLTSARSFFTDTYQPSNVQAFRQQAVISAAMNQVALIRDAYTEATSGLENDQKRNRVIYDLNSVAVNRDFGGNPEVMDRAIVLGLTAISQSVPDAATKFETFRGTANNAAQNSSFSSPASDAENAVYALVRITSAAYMAEAAMASTDNRTGQIFEFSDIINAILEQEIINARQACQNGLFLALTKFRDETTARLAGKAYSAPGIVDYDFGGQVHPLVASYAIFGTAKRHRELEALNIMGRYGRIGSPVAATAAG